MRRNTAQRQPHPKKKTKNKPKLFLASTTSPASLKARRAKQERKIEPRFLIEEVAHEDA